MKNKFEPKQPKFASKSKKEKPFGKFRKQQQNRQLGSMLRRGRGQRGK